MFTKEACSLMGLSKESPLSITVDAGCKALPALNSIRQVSVLVGMHWCCTRVVEGAYECKLQCNITEIIIFRELVHTCFDM